MKSVRMVIAGISALVFCSSPTNHNSEDFKIKILNNSDECTWYFSSYIDSTEKYVVLTDSMNSKYDIITTSYSSSRTMTYKFTQDSAFMDYMLAHSSWVERCGPYIITGSDTIPGDSVLCASSGIAPPPAITHERGTWGCDAGTIYFHCTGIAYNTADYSDKDTLEQFSYYFSNNGDTLYIGNNGSFSGFIRK